MTKALFGTSVVASLAVVIAAIAVFLRQSLPRSYGPFTDLVTFGDSYTDEARRKFLVSMTLSNALIACNSNSLHKER